MGPCSILLIDDEPGLCLLLRKGLAAQGYRVYEAYDGTTGLAQFHALHPDVILLDGNLPDLDGFVVLQEIRSYDKGVGVIMISACSIKRRIAETLCCGADHYLVKPVNLQQIRDEVQRVSTLVRHRRSLAAVQCEIA